MPNVYGDTRQVAKAIDAMQQEQSAKRFLPAFRNEVAYRNNAWIFGHYDSRGGAFICFESNVIRAINKYRKDVFSVHNETREEKDWSINSAYADLIGQFEVVVLGGPVPTWEPGELDIGYSSGGPVSVCAVSPEEADRINIESHEAKHRNGFTVKDRNGKVDASVVYPTIRDAMEAVSGTQSDWVYIYDSTTPHSPALACRTSEGWRINAAMDDKFNFIVPTKIVDEPYPDNVYHVFRMNSKWSKGKWNEDNVLVLVHDSLISKKQLDKLKDDKDDKDEAFMSMPTAEPTPDHKYRMSVWDLGEDACGLVLF